MMEYQEKIVCWRCKTIQYRELEVFETLGQSTFENPLQILIVKKFECKKCQADSGHSIQIVKKINKKVAKVL